MKKILIIGCSGAGKSYLARKLRDILHIDLYYLDCLYWKENWTSIEKEEFDKKLDEILIKDSFIIDGNYKRTLERRVIASDTIIYLDYDNLFCLNEVYKRNGKEREDLPYELYKTEVVDDEFRTYIENFNDVERPKIYNILSKYPDKKIMIFKNRDELNKWVDELKK